MGKNLRWILLAVLASALVLAPCLAAGKLKKGDKAPAFTLTDLNGNRVSLADLAGKVVYLQFWVTECPMSKAALQHTQKLSRSAWANSGSLVVLAINEREEPATISAFMKKNKYDFRVPIDEDGRVTEAYDAEYTPVFVVIDRTGRIHWTTMGYNPQQSPDEIDRAIREALKR